MRCWAELCRWQGMRGWMALGLAGCAVISTPETQISAGRARFDSALISYRADSVPPAAVRPASGVQLAAYAQGTVPTSAAPGSTRLLQIQYPHPAGRAGFARVELILGSPPEVSTGTWPAQLRRVLRESMPGMSYAEGIAEAWALDVPVGEIDQILVRLEEQGYFSPESPAATAGTVLTAKIDGIEFQRPWHSSEEFEDLAVRVRRDGTLVSHRQPLEPAFAPAATAPSRPGVAFAVEPVVFVLERLPPIEPAAGR